MSTGSTDNVSGITVPVIFLQVSWYCTMALSNKQCGIV